MKIEQIYTGCLAQGAYYIVSGGEAAVIDPLRETAPYLERIKKDNVKLKYIFETHFHADFVSGHLDLAKATGATIVYGPTAKPQFDAYIAKDMETFPLGDVNIQVLHTPGHTMESSCFLLQNETKEDYALFTGDTLFLGDVGRPDLAQKAAQLTTEELAALLYRSLHNKIMPLRDEVILYPGHGAGSACGKHMSDETVSTLGAEKRSNYALRTNMTESEFVKEVTNGLLPPPGYFPLNASMNKSGYESVDNVLSRAARALSPASFETLMHEPNFVVIDTRSAAEFSRGFIPGSIHIGLDGQFAPWLGALIPDLRKKILIVAPAGSEKETAIRMARVGYDQIIGYLENGFRAWKKDGRPNEQIRRISAPDFEKQWNSDNDPVFDVRRASEFESGHLILAENTPLNYIYDHLSKFPKDHHFYLHCAGGYRSMIAASILKAKGWDNFTEIESGMNGIRRFTGLEIREESDKIAH